MDITSFITWFVGQVSTIFQFTYNTLNNITFAGTSLLKVIITITIIIPLLYVVITIPMNPQSAYREGVRQKQKNEIREDK